MIEHILISNILNIIIYLDYPNTSECYLYKYVSKKYNKLFYNVNNIYFLRKTLKVKSFKWKNLLNACINGNLKLFKFIYSSYNLKRILNYSYAAKLAIFHNHNEVAKLILFLSYDSDIVDIQGWANQHNHYKFSKMILFLDPDFKLSNNYLIENATFYGHLKLVKLSVSLGADVKPEDNYHILWASKNGKYKTVKYLISLGADRITNAFL